MRQREELDDNHKAERCLATAGDGGVRDELSEEHRKGREPGRPGALEAMIGTFGVNREVLAGF